MNRHQRRKAAIANRKASERQAIVNCNMATPQGKPQSSRLLREVSRYLSGGLASNVYSGGLHRNNAFGRRPHEERSKPFVLCTSLVDPLIGFRQGVAVERKIIEK